MHFNAVRNNDAETSHCTAGTLFLPTRLESVCSVCDETCASHQFLAIGAVNLPRQIVGLDCSGISRLDSFPEVGTREVVSIAFGALVTPLQFCIIGEWGRHF